MKSFRRLWPYLLLVVLIACNVTVWLQRDRIADWWRLRDYSAPQEIAVLASDTTMTDLGQHLFFVNHPSLEEKSAFNEHCADHDEETAVLGCYHGDRRGIYLYAVTDPRLEGVREVTAAHEMLHQAYDRLGDSERERIEGLLQTLYDSGTMSADIHKKIDSYRKHGADLANEMHSIFGTEARTLTPDLEEYYSRYFRDRQAVVGLYETYRGEFTRRQDLAKQYEQQMKEVKGQFDANKSQLNQKSAFLDNKEKEINNALASNDRAAYESAIAEYNDMVRVYNAQLAVMRRLADDYKRVSAERNAILVQEHELEAALDSRLESDLQEQ
jgi:hypothetical protein